MGHKVDSQETENAYNDDNHNNKRWIHSATEQNPVPSFARRIHNLLLVPMLRYIWILLNCTGTNKYYYYHNIYSVCMMAMHTEQTEREKETIGASDTHSQFEMDFLEKEYFLYSYIWLCVHACMRRVYLYWYGQFIRALVVAVLLICAETMRIASEIWKNSH